MDERPGYDEAVEAIVANDTEGYCLLQDEQGPWPGTAEGRREQESSAGAILNVAYPIIEAAVRKDEAPTGWWQAFEREARADERRRIAELLRNTGNVGVMEPKGSDWASFIERELS